MRCIFCSKVVLGKSGVTVSGKGPAHQHCLTLQQALERNFGSLIISELTDDQLVDLKDLVLSEINDRCRDEEDEGIELF